MPLLDRMDPLLTNAAYQRLWGWDNCATPAAWPPPQAALSQGSSPVSATISMQATSAKAVRGSHKTIISSGGCMQKPCALRSDTPTRAGRRATHGMRPAVPASRRERDRSSKDR